MRMMHWHWSLCCRSSSPVLVSGLASRETNSPENIFSKMVGSSQIRMHPKSHLQERTGALDIQHLHKTMLAIFHNHNSLRHLPHAYPTRSPSLLRTFGPYLLIFPSTAGFGSSSFFSLWRTFLRWAAIDGSHSCWSLQ